MGRKVGTDNGRIASWSFGRLPFTVCCLSGEGATECSWKVALWFWPHHFSAAFPQHHIRVLCSMNVIWRAAEMIEEASPGASSTSSGRQLGSTVQDVN